MIELRNNELIFNFPDVHPKARCRIDFQRTLRIPDDNSAYSLPPGLGSFPLNHVDDFAGTLPTSWKTHGGAFFPMYQAEAMWLNFGGNYPCAIKITAGKINAISGEAWTNALSSDPQDYVVVPKQPWLDGFNVSEGHVRQFVAMPLGAGYSAEEQITGSADVGGLQLIIFPMKREVYDKLYGEEVTYSLFNQFNLTECPKFMESSSMEMGLAPGGLMKQEIYDDEFGVDAWDQTQGLRCFVHLANSEQFKAITGSLPPHPQVTTKDYSNAGMPWYDFYSEKPALGGAEVLAQLKGLAAKTIEIQGAPLQGNETVQPTLVTSLRRAQAVRDGCF